MFIKTILSSRQKILLPSLTLLATLAVPGLQAQEIKLDQSKLIDGLAQRGLSEMLFHLAETGEFDDASEPRLLEVGQFRIIFNDPDRPIEDRIEAFEQARRILTDLTSDPQFDEHPQKPIWRTDLTEMLLVNYLEGFKQAANGFYEFGVPTQEQIEAYEDAAAQAVEQMLKAQAEFVELDTRLSRNPEQKRELEQSQAYFRIFDDYRDEKSTFFTGYALHYGSLLPDDHPYFQNLGDIPGQRNSPDEERRRLRQTAVQALGPVVEGDVRGRGLQPRALSVSGRSTLLSGDARRATTEFLDEATDSNDWNLDVLGAHIAEAIAVEQQGRADAARGQLLELTRQPDVRRNLLFRLLTTDALHRLMLRQAEAAPASRRDEETSQAYQVYFDLIEDPELGDQAAGVRNLVFDRWASSSQPGDDLTKLPPAVRMAIAERARLKGMAAMQAGNQSEMQQFLQQAVEAGETLKDPQSVGETVWANGQFNAAFAKYLQNTGNLQNLLEASAMATEVAAKTPDQPVATDAINLASSILEPLHRQYAAMAGVAPAYERAMEVLFDSGNFDATQPYDDRLLYFAFVRHQSKGEFREAIEFYNKQLRSHPNYLEAQAQLLFSLSQLLKQAGNTSQAQSLREETLSAAEAAEAEAEQALNRTGDAYQQTSANRALANARIARAEVYASQGDTAQAIEALRGFEQQFADSPDLVRLGLERRILLLVEAEQLEEAKQAASQMMQQFPDAAAGVINSVLTGLERRIDQQEQRAANPDLSTGEQEAARAEAARLAETAAAMAGLLSQWASNQGFDEAQMLPYHIIYLKSLRVAGQSQAGLDYIQENQLASKWDNNAEVLYEQAMALIGTGNPEQIKRASGLLNKVIGNLAEPYPPLYWQAWEARLNINLLLNENVGEVARRVEQLKVRFPDLGGEPYASRLRDLQAKAQSQLGQ
jgi:tetratricopeptide (TPR) repeat protein